MNELFHFYKHDATVFRASDGVDYDITIDFPIGAEWVHERLGFRVLVKVADSATNGMARNAKTFVPIANHTSESAIGRIKAFIETVANTPPSQI